MRDYNFKARLLDDSASEKCYTKGKIYEIVDGVLTWDDGDTTKRHGRKRFKNIQQLVEYTLYDFELVEDYNTTDDFKIEITTKNNKTIATLFESGKYKKHTIARCCPEDTYNFEVGANIAFNRLIQTPVCENVESEETKTNTYKIGDKVKLRSDLLVGEKYGGITLLEDMSGLIGKDATICGISEEGNLMFKEKNTCYYYSPNMLENYENIVSGVVSNMSVITTEDLIKELSRRIDK